MNSEPKYSDIMGILHYEPKRHPRMDIGNRAAQFAPFAALTGYGDAVQETARLTEDKIEVSEAVKEQLDEKLRTIMETAGKYPIVTITYFAADKRKSGGEYIRIAGRLKKVDEYGRQLVLENVICEEEYMSVGIKESQGEEIYICMEDVLEIQWEEINGA